MKKIIYVIIGLALAACEKEELTQSIRYENLYTIQDDPSDSVKHRVYEIYEKYGVPVYFNDTIGEYYVKDDIDGNPYYQYELVDLNWNFFSHNGRTVTYQFFYQTDPERQMNSLDFVEDFLDGLSGPLYPSSIFLSDSLFSYGNDTREELYSRLLFRSISFARIPDLTSENRTMLRDVSIQNMIKQRIANFEKQLIKFYAISRAAWYYKNWTDLGLEFNGWWSTSLLTETGRKRTQSDYNWTDERLQTEWDKVRNQVGQFGFVGSSGLTSPENTSQDLDQFMEEALSCDRTEFIRRWENCPLVIKKYEILYELLKTELDYEL